MNLRHSPKPNKPLRQLLVVLLFGILFFSLAFFTVPIHAQTTGLVTCGLQHGTGTETAFCTICDLIVLIQNIMNKAMYIFAAPIAAFMLGYGGFLMVWAGVKGGDSAMYGKGKTVMTNSLIGIVIIFSSWLLIDTLMKGLGAYQYAASANFGPWNQIECQAPAISLPKHMGCNGDTCEMVDGSGSAVCSGPKNCGPNATHSKCDFPNQKCAEVPGQGTDDCTSDAQCIGHKTCVVEKCQNVPGPGADTCANDDICLHGIIPPSESNKEIAERLGATVDFDKNADCNGKSAYTNINELQNGQPLSVCHAGCSIDKKPCTQTNITADSNMLADLDRMANKEGLTYRVTSIATGDHTDNSDHYKGKGVDIKAIGNTTYVQLEASVKQDSNVRFTQCEDRSGANIPCSSSPQNITHFHISYK